MARIHNAFRAALQLNGWTQQRFSDAAGLPRSTIANWMTGRPTSSRILRALVSTWPDRRIGLEIFTAYVLDLAESTGIDPQELTVKPYPNAEVRGFGDDLRTLQDLLEDQPDLASWLSNLAGMARAARGVTWDRKAAEDPGA